jgi:hypothetical protein
MSRGTTLVKLLDMLRLEIKASVNPAHNAQVRDMQVNALQQAQKDLWEDFAWPHLRVERTIKLLTGKRFYDLASGTPSDLPIDRIEDVFVKWNEEWCPLENGIGATQYAHYDSQQGEQTWPVERWRIYEDEQIEVWPMPDQDGTESTQEGYLKFIGIRNLRPLVDDDDRCDLDDRLIIMRAAISHFLTGERLNLTTSAYQQRLLNLRGAMTISKPFRLYGSQAPDTRQLRGPPRVHYRVNET